MCRLGCETRSASIFGSRQQLGNSGIKRPFSKFSATQTFSWRIRTDQPVFDKCPRNKVRTWKRRFMYFGYIFSLGAPIQLSFQKSSTSAGKPTLFKEGNILQPYNWQPSRPQIPYRTGINKISLFLFNGGKKAGKSGANPWRKQQT